MKIQKYLKYDDIKVGEEYFFVDTDFPWSDVECPTIKKEKVYRKITGDFSTKNDGDRYEVVRHMAYTNIKDAKEEAKEELERYREYINKNIDNALEELSKAKSS